ncbi:MAG: recombinase RecT [Erysipelotrichaceae bacterium]
MAENTQVARTGTKTTFMAYMSNDAVKNQISKVVQGKNGDRFITAIISAVQTNPALQECSNQSIVSAALLGETLKLSPSPQLGQYYMVPFNNTKKGVKEAQFQLGYKGYIQLAIRSGFYKKLNVVAIKEGELVQYSPLDEEIEINLIEDEEERENAITSGYYAMFEYTNGFKKTLYWSKAKMEAHAIKYSMGYKAKKGYTFWEKDFDGMAFKTMLRQLISKWGIMSIEMQNAFEDDMAVVDDKGNRTYVDGVSFENEVQAEIEQNANTEDFKEAIGTRETTVNESAPADPGF